MDIFEIVRLLIFIELTEFRENKGEVWTIVKF